MIILPRRHFAPAGDGAQENRVPALDIRHLERQTTGDETFEHDVLRLFLDESGECVRRIKDTQGQARSEAAHRLKGAARGIGAFPLAQAAGVLEEFPDDPDTLDHVLRNLAATERAIRERTAGETR